MNHMKAALRITILLALILAMISGSAMSESYDAGTMRLLRYEGSVEIFDPEGVPRFVLENVRFASGESMQTGEDGIASVGLDDTKIVTLDASSRVQFIQEDSHLKLSLTQGSLFLDVQDKLDENESLDIETSTMTVGIRGTIAFLYEDPEGISSAGGRGATSVGILEGTAQIDFKDASGARRRMDVPAGRKVTIPAPDNEQGGVLPEMAQLTSEDVSGFVAEQVLRDPVLIERVINGSPEGEEILHPGTVKETSDTWIGFDFPADGDWVWSETVTLVAQSASKLYDGQTLRRSSDVLVYGLPQGLSIQVAANGALTDAGETENNVGNYHIYNAAREDVTNHFTSVEKVSGTLKVDPAPLTVWTGSAEKYYDGTPLTNEEAELRTVPGYEVNEPVWRNTSIVTRSALGSESMISVSGATWVHGTNPLTGETREIILYTGQKLTVCLNSEENQESIDFMVETLPVEKLPEEVLRLYAANPELRTRACKDAGWDETKLKKRIAELGKTEGRTVTRKGLRVPETVENDLMQDSSNVRITVDSDVTNYNSRPLNGDEAHFVPIEIDPTISIEAIGSQTEPGESLNTYEIKWGRANPKNYLISEELGTLTVLPVYKNETTLTAASVEKVYDGKPLENTEFEIAELPEGYTVEAKVEGSLTDAGEAENKITEYKILDEDGKDATKAFPNLKVVSGTLKVTPAPLTVKTGSAEKVYDGEALVSEEAEITGLVNDEKAEIAATGSLTEAGTAKNTYTITWDTAKKENYEIQETVGTLTVEELKIEVGLGGTETSYNGGAFIPQPVLTYLNGSHAGETVSGTRLRAMDVMYRFALFTGETVDLTISGMGTGAGTYTLTGSATTSSGSSVNLDLTLTQLEVVITPAPLTITTGSASKLRDGTPLTCAEVQVEGLQGDDQVTVTATGKLEEAGTTPNTYTIDWGDTDQNNYTIVEKLGKLEMTTVDTAVTLTAPSVTRAYDGTPLTATTVKVEGLPEGYTFSAEITGSQTDVGSSDNVISSYQIKNPDGTDVTAAFTDVTPVNGTLKVEPLKVNVDLGGSGTFVYDGQYHGAVPAVTCDNSNFSLTKVSDTQWDINWSWSDVIHFSVTGGGKDAGDYSLSSSGYSCTNTESGYCSPDNFDVVFTGRTLKIERLQLKFDLHGGTRVFGEGATILTVSAVYGNGNHAGEEIGPPNTGIGGVATIGSQTEVHGTFFGDDITLGVWGYAEEDVGDYSISHSFESEMGNESNYEVICTNDTYHVTPATVIITTGSAEKTYDGTALTKNELTVTGLVGTPRIEYTDEQRATVTVTGSRTEVGESDNTYSIDWREYKPGNYIIEDHLGKLTVKANENPVTVTAGPYWKEYDGTPLVPGPESISVTGLPDGFTWAGTVSGSQTNAGTGTSKITSFTIYDSSHADVTSSFTDIKYMDGELSVTPVEILLTLNTVDTIDGIHPVYNGYPWVPNGIEARYGDDTEAERLSQIFLGDEDRPTGIRAVFSLKGNGKMQVECGGFTDAGDYTYEPNITFPAGDGNYKIVNIIGQLTSIQPLEITFDLGGNEEIIYDGEFHGPDLHVSDNTESYHAEKTGGTTWKVTGGKSDVIAVTITGGGKDIGEYPLECSYEFESGSESNFIITTVYDTIKINPGAVTIKAKSATKPYDGTPLTATEVTTEGLPNGYTCEAEITGSQLRVGSSDNVISNYQILNPDGTDVTAAFTDVTKVNGTLTVTVNDTPIMIAANSESFVYCGETLSSFGSCTVKGLPESIKTLAEAMWSAKDVGTYTIHPSCMAWDDEGQPIDLDECFSHITFVDSTLKVEPLQVKIDMNAKGSVFGQNASAPGIIVTYTNGAHEGEEVSAGDGAMVPGSITKVYELFTGDTLTLVAANWAGGDAGTYQIEHRIEMDEALLPNYAFTVEDDTYEITPATVSITTGSAEKYYDGTALTSEELTVTGLVGDPRIGYADEQKAVVTVTGSQTEIGESDNTYSIDWREYKPGNYIIENHPGKLKVKAHDEAVTFTAGSATKVFDGSALTTSKVDVSGLPEGYTYEAVVTGSQTDAGSSASKVTSYHIYNTAHTDVTSSFTNVTTEDGTLEVTPLAITIETEAYGGLYCGYPIVPETIRVTYSDNTEEEGDGGPVYDDEEWPVGYKAVYNLKGGGQMEVECGSFTDANTYTIVPNITFTAGKSSNYAIKNPGTKITIEKLALELDLGGWDGERSYDGNFHGPNLTVSCDTESHHPEQTGDTTWRVTGGKNDVINVTITGGGKDVGEYSLNCSYSFESGKESNFTITKANETIKIKSAPLTIKTESATKTFDGTPLTSPTPTVTGLIGEDQSKVSITVTGTITDAGSTPNAYTVDWNGVKETNYALTEDIGTLTIKKSKIKVTTNDYSKTYDGLPLPETTDQPYINGDFVEPDIYATYTQNKIQDAGSTKATYEMHWGEAKENNYEVSEELGTLKINPRNLTVSTPDGEKTYDGTLLTKGGASVDGLVEGESVTVNVTGSITDAGTASNSFTINWGDVKSGNYTLTEKPGTLTVKRRPLKVTSKSAEKTWDGEPLTCEEYTVEGLVDGESITVEFTGSRTDVGESDNTFDVEFNSAKEGNYDLTKEYGKLTVNEVPWVTDGGY